MTTYSDNNAATKIHHIKALMRRRYNMQRRDKVVRDQGDLNIAQDVMREICAEENFGYGVKFWIVRDNVSVYYVDVGSSGKQTILYYNDPSEDVAWFYVMSIVEFIEKYPQRMPRMD